MNRSSITINISISMSAVFLSAENHESRDQSRSKNVKQWGLNLKKNCQRLYGNIAVCTINSLPTSNINRRESSCTRRTLRTHTFLFLGVGTFLAFLFRRRKRRSKISISSNSSSSSWSAILDYRVQIHMRKMQIRLRSSH